MQLVPDWMSDADSEEIAAEMPARPRYFIPVCLYPHTKYRTRQGILDLIAKFRLAEFDHLIVVADHLLALDKIVTGRYWNEKSVFQKARQESHNVFRLIKKVSDKENTGDHCRLAYWDDIAATDTFTAVRSRLVETCRAKAAFMAVVDCFVDERVERFGMGADPDRERQAELDYILGEITMSIYCTEILSYWFEIWERPLAADSVDPLRILYENFPDIVTTACQRPRTIRRLRFLSEISLMPASLLTRTPARVA